MAIKRGSIFNYIRPTKVGYSTFNVGYENKLSMKMGKLVPFFCKTVVPGDRVKLDSSFFVRMAPLVNPIMHRVDVRYHYFFVPFRLLWKNWENFRAEGNGDVLASERETYSAPTHPYLFLNGEPEDSASSFGAGSLTDYLSLIPASRALQVLQEINYAPSPVPNLYISPMRLAAYYCIYDNYYRVQDMELSFLDFAQTSRNSDSDLYVTDGRNYVNLFQAYNFYHLSFTHSDIDGTESSLQFNNTLFGPLEANWEKDYFTSALPSPQLGEATNIPVGTSAPVTAQTNNLSNNWTDTTFNVPEDGKLTQDTLAKGNIRWIAELQNATGITITDLRSLFQLQRLKERLAQTGTRYKEWLQGIFGVTDKDSRLDRPEYLGGGSQPISISEVLQTSETGDTPLGDYAGRGVSAGTAHSQNYQVPEDGVIMGIMSIVPRTSYYQGTPRDVMYTSPYDYFNPYFEHVGEQEVYSEELFAGTGKSVFGYQSRYCEYKYSPDEVHGDFTTDSYLSWHLARKFDNQPTLSAKFMKVPQMDRIFSVTDPDYDKFYCDIFNNFIANRPMSQYSEPY